MNHKGPYLLDLSSTLLIHDISFVHCVDFKVGNALGHWDLDDLEWMSGLFVCRRPC